MGQVIRKLLRAAIVVLMATLGVGCAEVPEEAVTLSVTVGKDLAELHRANRALAEHYFARSKSDIENFIDETYRPYIVRDTMQRLQMLNRLSEQMNKPDGRPLDFMQLFVEKTLARIEKTRSDLLAPLEQNEKKVLRGIDDAYANIINAQAVVTGHLVSVRKVQQAQDEFLSRAGFDNLRKNLIDATAMVSDKIADVTAEARKGEKQVEEAVVLLEKILGDKNE